VSVLIKLFVGVDFGSAACRDDEKCKTKTKIDDVTFLTRLARALARDDVSGKEIKPKELRAIKEKYADNGSTGPSNSIWLVKLLEICERPKESGPRSIKPESEFLQRVAAGEHV
jgi:hypothetical protein